MYKLVTIFLLSMALLACGSNKKVARTDDSIDYSVAQSLPPLQKPDGGLAVTTNAVQDSNVKSVITSLPGDQARVDLDVNIDQAWAIVGEKLKQAGFTIYYHNEVDGVYSIGCQALGISGKPEKKSKRIFFLNKKQSSDYCGVKVTKNKAGSNVFILDRSGRTVSEVVSKTAFKKLNF